MAKDGKGNLPDIDQELERLKNLGILKNDFLDGLYQDLFTADQKEGESVKTGKEPEQADIPQNVSSLNPPQNISSKTPALTTPDLKQSEPAQTAETSHSQAEEKKPEKEEEDPLETLDKLIGLDTIKHDVRELTDFVRIQKMRSDQGLKSVPVSLHLVFTGNPGTGKTTVARILAKLYQQIGVLSKGQLVEVDRSGLVAGYVGQTALKTQEQIEKALGGVLFIDEAYALAQKDDAFGQEAIDTILKAMEDHRDDLVVIVAGYTKPMEKFINSNPGLKSRFNKYIEFPDYTVDELMAIFELNCKKYDYILGEDVKKHVREMIVSRKLTKTDNFANAREVRNLFEEIITNQARRVAALKKPSQMDMMSIDLEDLADEAMKSGSEKVCPDPGNPLKEDPNKPAGAGILSTGDVNKPADPENNMRPSASDHKAPKITPKKDH